MLYFDRIDACEGTDVNKTSASRNCDIYHYRNIAILHIKGSDYRCIISLISKNETINLMQNSDLTVKSGTL